MTYIEFFSPTVSENICACLARAPERVILVGGNRRLLKKHAERYQNLFLQRGAQIQFLTRVVNKNDMQNVINALSELVETYDDCIFDLTGGKDTYLVATGIVSERYSARQVQLQRFNLRNGTLMDCDLDGRTLLEWKMPSLSVEENIQFFGGEVIREGEFATYQWDLNPDFVADVAIMWEICRRDAGRWNMVLNLFELAQKLNREKGQPLRSSASLSDMRRSKYYATEKYFSTSDVVEDLCSEGILTHCSWEDDTLVVAYKNAQLKKVLTKAGTLLELVMFFAAKLATDGRQPVYNDVMTGVSINWNASEREGKVITHNEIDVIMMHGMVPVFVSCKSGLVEMEELFKFGTVADRFGGAYAKRVLVAPRLTGLSNEQSIRARAEDMNIQILDNAYTMTFTELESTVASLWKTMLKRN